MKERRFTAKDGNVLVIKNRKSAVILEHGSLESDSDWRFTFSFSEEAFDEVKRAIQEAAEESWSGLTRKDATDLGTDYYEYYDRKYDNNGYLSLEENALELERPTTESNKLYQFNKRRMESFLYDLETVKA
ncbi:hypothetical protein IMZ31_20045 (plasmid) [Pontibacillus sp. ALD_SL1]|uniref:hypothetical protein n=1 Tax=Pontibacillus sp. ALD_SL1 TaxID=2777185 RepID=UPI001A973DA4|nr:hypothetical protein [Pontibacillus sp. ALD_SL1]QST02844.1 hypothetical protein IMZ31_20045 [Pontibacillus sp. ALD_SL1]